MRKQVFLFITALFVFLFVFSAYSQEQKPSVVAPAKKAAPPAKKVTTATPQVQKTEPQSPANELTVEQVVQLIQAGLSEDLIIAKIKKNNKAFDLSTEQLLQLKKVGASDNIIRVLMDPQAQPVAAPAAPPAAAPSTPATTPSPPPAAQSSVSAPADEPIPDEQGVYWTKEGKELIRLEGKAISNIRTGSRLANWATAGIKRTRINAQLKGARAETRLKEHQPQFCLYLSEEASIGDYLLIRMAQRLDVRQIEIGQATFWKQQSGIDHTKEVEFTHKRIKPRVYIVTPNRELEPGEYGFFVAAGIELKKPTGRIYDFGIDP